MRFFVRQFYALPLSFCAVIALAQGAQAGQFDAPQHNLTVQVAAAAEAKNLEPAKNFVSKMTATGIGFLGNEKLTDEQRTAEFRKLLNANFDMQAIGRFALGTSWKTATPAQQTEYQKLFKEMIVQIYSRRFKEYNGQQIDITGARADGDDVIVSSVIVPPQGSKVKVDWRVRNKGGYKIVDILVEGVSMALTQRSDFASVIQQGGGNVEALLTHMRQQ